MSRVDDLRPDTGSLGDANGHQLAGDALASLRLGLEAMPGHREIPAVLHLQIELLKAYVQGLSSLKTANLVARVRYSYEETPIENHVYRGTHDGLNWFDTQSEWLSTFAKAQQDLLGQIATDIGRLCPGAQGSVGPRTN